MLPLTYSIPMKVSKVMDSEPMAGTAVHFASRRMCGALTAHYERKLVAPFRRVSCVGKLDIEIVIEDIWISGMLQICHMVLTLTTMPSILEIVVEVQEHFLGFEPLLQGLLISSPTIVHGGPHILRLEK